MSGDDSQNVLLITTYMLQFHDIPNIIKQMPDQYPPTSTQNQKEQTFILPTIRVR
jgi:hypothetical protein